MSLICIFTPNDKLFECGNRSAIKHCLYKAKIIKVEMVWTVQ